MLIDAEINPQDSFGDLTSAIVQAFRTPTMPSSSRSLPPPQKTVQALTGQGEEEAVETDVQEEEAEAASEEKVVTTTKPPRTRAKLPVPEYVHDLFKDGLDSDFRAYTDSKAPSSQAKKYLTAAAWLKDNKISQSSHR